MGLFTPDAHAVLEPRRAPLTHAEEPATVTDRGRNLIRYRLVLPSVHRSLHTTGRGLRPRLRVGKTSPSWFRFLFFFKVHCFPD